MKRLIKKSIRTVLEFYLCMMNNFFNFIGYIYSIDFPRLRLRKWIDERLQN